MRVFELHPGEKRRAENCALLVTMTPSFWEPAAEIPGEALPKTFLRTFKEVPLGSWVGITSSLFAVNALEPEGFVDMIRAMQARETLDIASCNIERYANEADGRSEAWLALVLRKLCALNRSDTIQNTDRAA